MKKKLLAFLQNQYYKPKYEAVLKNYSDYEINIISREQLSLDGSNISSFYSSSLRKIAYELFRIRNTQFDVLLASNVDDKAFQILFRYLRFGEFHSFDEGQRSLQKDDYYFANTIPFKGQRRNLILNKIFGFPLPLMDYFKNSKKHYAFYNPKIFDHALADHPSLQFQELSHASGSISKIFVGVSSFWYTDFQKVTLNPGTKVYKELMLQAASNINSILPDIYLMHPRENHDLVNLLDDRIVVFKNMKGGNEAFINKLANLNSNLQVFVERTGLVFDLNKKINITFINLFNRFSEQSFNSFVENFESFREDKYINKGQNE